MTITTNTARFLQAIDFRPQDTLYVLGDVVDRGPDGVKIHLNMMRRSHAAHSAGLCRRLSGYRRGFYV